MPPLFAMPMLSKPEDYNGDWDDETNYSWDNLARQQLALEDFGTTLEDGDVYALLDRDCIAQDSGLEPALLRAD